MAGQIVCCLSWLGTVSELFEGPLCPDSSSEPFLDWTRGKVHVLLLAVLEINVTYILRVPTAQGEQGKINGKKNPCQGKKL